MTQFTDLGLAEPILRAVTDEGYTTPTPIQAKAIPPLLTGRDMLGIAQTGTGKTAAFALPILHRLVTSGRPAPAKSMRVLVLAPTRELAAQIADSFRSYGRHARTSVAVVVGGVSHRPQIQAMARGVDVLVATPGRLLDHVDSGAIRLDCAEVVVLDEADHMLDLGFLVPIRRILKMLSHKRQNLFFSATMPKQIATLAGEMLKDPVQVAVTPVATTAERIQQQVYLIEASRKGQLLVEVLQQPDFTRPIVFTRTKRGADKVAKLLDGAGLPAAAIHGNKSQNQRERALDDFKRGRIKVMVATDIAARGIDIDGVSHVVNYELPEVPESYVHRIGRTARAGAEGSAVSFCCADEQGLLRDIEKLTRQSLPKVDRRTPGLVEEPKPKPAPRGRGAARPSSGSSPRGGEAKPAHNQARPAKSGQRRRRPGGGQGQQRAARV